MDSATKRAGEEREREGGWVVGRRKVGTKLPASRSAGPTKLSTGNQQNKSGKPAWYEGINEFLPLPPPRCTLSNQFPR